MRGWVPSRRLVGALALPALFSLWVWFEPAFLPYLFALDGSLVLLALLDALTVRRAALVVQRETPAVLSIGCANPIRLLIRSRSRRPLSVQLDDGLFAHARAEGLPLGGRLAARASLTLEYRLFPERRGA